MHTIPDNATRIKRFREVKATLRTSSPNPVVDQRWRWTVVVKDAKGKLTARERIDLLLDKGSFREVDAFEESV